MQLLIAIVSVLLAGTLVVLVPGACLVAAWRVDRVVAPPLVPAAAAALGLVPLTIVMSAALLLHLPIVWVAGALAVLVLALWIRLASCARAWWLPLRDLVAGEWLRGTPLAALMIAAAGGMLALYTGFYAWNDSLYHIAQAQKLLMLDHPTFSNTLQFPDGSAHPGYLLPAWQQVIALTAFVSHQDPVTVAWILPAVTFPVGLLAFGGLGWVAARARAATSVTAASVLLATVATLPYSDAITNAMQPGVFALGVLAPLTIAMVLTALWPAPRNREHGDAVPAHTVTRAATIIAMLATAGVGMLNIGYLWVLGMGVLGYALLWALRAPWPRAVVRRHLAVGMSIALVVGVVLALLYPGLSHLESLGRTAAAELAATSNTQYQGENGADLQALLRGNPDGAYHLRADYLIQSGGLALLGLIGLLLPIAMPRWPGGWYLQGAGLLALGIALSNRVFPHFVDVVTLDQARRIERVLPLSLGLAALVIAIALVARWCWRRTDALSRIGAGAVLVGGAAAMLAVTSAVPRLAGYAGERIVNPRILVIVLAVLAAWVLIQACGLVIRLTRHTRTPSEQWPTPLIDARAGMLALLILLIAAIPVLPRLGDVADATRLDQVPISMRGAELRLFDARVAAALRRLPVESTVLADPRTRNPYTAMAIAPVYVVSSVPRHTALTPKNRVTERFDLAVLFFADDITLTQRRQYLIDHHVDAVLVHPAASSDAQQQLQQLPGVRMVASGKNQRLYVIDRAKLRRSTT